MTGVFFFQKIREYLAKWWLMVVASCLYLPMAFFGYGSDVDTFRVLDAGRNFLATADYVPSRRPGYLVYELSVYGLDQLGGSVLSNLSTVFWALVAVASFVRICRRHNIQNAAFLTLILIAHPVFWYNATVTADYIWALGMIMVGFDWLERDRFIWSGLAFGLAIGCRLSAAIAVGSLCVYAWLAFPNRRLRAVAMAGLSGFLGALAYILPWDFAEWRASFWQVSAGAQTLWTPGMQWGRFIYKNLYFWGLPAVILLLVLIWVGVRRSRVWHDDKKWPLWILAAASFIGYELLFYRFPIEVEYLLPVLPFVLLMIGISISDRKLLLLLLVLVFSYNFFTINLARPNQPGQASGAVYGVWVEPGYMLQETQARLRLVGCADHTCYDQRIDPRPSEALPDQ